MTRAYTSQQSGSYNRNPTIFSFVLLLLSATCLSLLMFIWGYTSSNVTPSLTGYALFVIQMISAIVGITRYSQSTHKHDRIEKLYTICQSLRSSLLLMLFTCEMLNLYHLEYELHACQILAVIFNVPFLFLSAIKSNGASKHISNALNVYHIVTMSFILYASVYANVNYYALNVLATFVFVHFFVGDTYTFYDHPAIDFYNYGFVFFNLFAFMSLSNTGSGVDVFFK